MIIYGKDIATRTLAMGIGGLLLVLAILFGVSQCDKRRSERAQERVEDAQHGAAIESGQDAVNTVSRSGEAERASEELTRTNEQEIRNAQGADERVGAGVNAAGLRSLCRRPAYRDHERCKLFNATPR